MFHTYHNQMAGTLKRWTDSLPFKLMVIGYGLNRLSCFQF